MALREIIKTLLRAILRHITAVRHQFNTENDLIQGSHSFSQVKMLLQYATASSEPSPSGLDDGVENYLLKIFFFLV